MGDNRDNSHDSRFWGPVHYDLIKGKSLVHLVVGGEKTRCASTACSTGFTTDEQSQPPAKPKDGVKVLARNKKARHEFFIEETIEAGIVLMGSEVRIAARQPLRDRGTPTPRSKTARPSCRCRSASTPSPTASGMSPSNPAAATQARNCPSGRQTQRSGRLPWCRLRSTSKEGKIKVLLGVAKGKSTSTSAKTSAVAEPKQNSHGTRVELCRAAACPRLAQLGHVDSRSRGVQAFASVGSWRDLAAIYNRVEHHIEARWRAGLDRRCPRVDNNGDRSTAPRSRSTTTKSRRALFVLIHLFGHTVQWNAWPIVCWAQYRAEASRRPG